ncbi:MAG: DUF2232 domain-containing protein [bacterium]|nr:DUF2232 domain-containing protein [bacterium]
MNRSARDTELTANAENAITSDRRSAVWPVLAAMVAFPLLNYGVPMWTSNLLLGTASIALAYFLGIFVVRGVAIAAIEGRVRLLMVTAVVAAALGGAACHPQQLLMAEANFIALVAAGLIIGWRAKVEKSQLKLYLWGLMVALAGGLIMWGPQWPLLMQTFSDSLVEMSDQAKEIMVASGYHEDVAEEAAKRARSMMDIVIKLIPTGTVMNVVTQFSVGFLWLLYRGAPGSVAAGELRPFGLWKAPFGLTPVMIVGILAMQFGGETLNLMGINALAALSLFYCVTGLSLLEHFLSRLAVPLWFKVMFYIVFALSGLIGYFGAVLLGFVDSFADWRKVSAGPMNLNNSD